MTFAECLIPKIEWPLCLKKNLNREEWDIPGAPPQHLPSCSKPHPLSKPPIPRIGHGNFYTGLLKQCLTFEVGAWRAS